MNRISMRAVGRHIGGGTALVCSVLLLTLLFSFLGTIACAAVAGMMLGASKQWRWRGIFVSLVFPVVIAAFLHFEKANLTPRQTLLLPMICFGTFWVTFFLTLIAPYFELQRGVSPAEQDAPIQKPPLQPEEDARVSGGQGPASRETSGRSGLDQLQGTWWCETAAGDGLLHKKTIRVTMDQVILSVLDPDGRAQVVTRGTLRLDQLGNFRVLEIVDSEPAPSGPSGPDAGTGLSIYRVAGRTLILVSNLEETAPADAAAMETYFRQGEAV